MIAIALFYFMKLLEIILDNVSRENLELNGLTQVLVVRNKEALHPHIEIVDKIQGVIKLVFPSIKLYLYMSQQQCEISYCKFINADNGHWAVKDGNIKDNINSLNGTYVNGVQLKHYEIRKLIDGDIIKFANQVYPELRFINTDKDLDNKDFSVLDHENEET